jgi:hypothetical protein
MTRLLARRLIAWLRPSDVAVHLPTYARFQVDFELERRQRDAREVVVRERKNVDAEKRIKLWIVK